MYFYAKPEFVVKFLTTVLLNTRRTLLSADLSVKIVLVGRLYSAYAFERLGRVKFVNRNVQLISYYLQIE